jgi:hypothetical protein
LPAGERLVGLINKIHNWTKNMSIENEFSFELVRSLLNVAVTLITLALGWFVGNRLSAAWAIRQKKREIELETVKEFYRIYGEFFSTSELLTPRNLKSHCFVYESQIRVWKNCFGFIQNLAQLFYCPIGAWR